MTEYTDDQVIGKAVFCLNVASFTAGNRASEFLACSISEKPYTIDTNAFTCRESTIEMPERCAAFAIEQGDCCLVETFSLERKETGYTRNYALFMLT